MKTKSSIKFTRQHPDSGLQNRSEQPRTSNGIETATAAISTSPDSAPSKPVQPVFDTPAAVQDPFGPVIFTYSRAQAVADGFQIEVTKTAEEAGIRFPVFLTRAVYDNYVVVPEALLNGPCGTHQDEAGRLWDILWMLRFAIMRARPGVDRLPVALYVRNDNTRARLIKLVAVCGPLDFDDPAPAITVMLPEED